MKIILAQPRGFCAGVDRAIETLEKVLIHRARTIYVLHEIVHNASVVEYFRQRGVKFVESLDEVPFGETLLFSAHGVSPAVRAEANTRFLETIDATCPLVARVHRLAKMYADNGFHIFYLGHAGHEEVVGTVGEAPDQITLITEEADIDRLVEPREADRTYLMQTTLSETRSQMLVTALRRRFPTLIDPPDAGICFATRNRQDAVSQLAAEADVVLVVGSTNSSNSRRLAELGAAAGKPSYLIDGPDDMPPEWFRPEMTLLLTAGASAPEALVKQCVAQLIEQFDATVEERIIHRETVVFKNPI